MLSQLVLTSTGLPERQTSTAFWYGVESFEDILLALFSKTYLPPNKFWLLLPEAPITAFRDKFARPKLSKNEKFSVEGSAFILFNRYLSLWQKVVMILFIIGRGKLQDHMLHLYPDLIIEMDGIQIGVQGVVLNNFWYEIRLRINCCPILGVLGIILESHFLTCLFSFVAEAVIIRWIS